VLRTVALGLAALHRSQVRPAVEGPLEEVLAQHRAAQQRLSARLTDARSRERAAACFDLLFARAEHLEPCEPALVHGALEWDCIVRSARPWSLYRFDRCRLAHPGLDVGVFLADLQRFHKKQRDGTAALGPTGRSAFVDAYFGDRPPPWSKDLDWFVAGALLGRLDRMMRRPEAKWAPKVVPLLEEIEHQLAT
jgi:aminoglycoside phosphotransferase (APT) family kinase protein